MKWPKSVKIYTDGASRGNPGPASIGVSFNTIEDEEFFTLSEAIGDNTNNYAEYFAMVRALRTAKENKVDNVWVRTDSEFMVKQLKGEYKIKSEKIKPLYEEAFELLSSFKKKKLEHVRRELNKRADELANQALDKLGATARGPAKLYNPFDDEF
jgi:ribonuclease HI